MAAEKKGTPAKTKSSGNMVLTKRKFGNVNKVTSQGKSTFSKPSKKKSNWKRGVKKYRGQGR